MIVIFMSTKLLYLSLYKVQLISLTCGLIEGDVIIYFLFFGIQGGSEVGRIFWIVIGYLFMVENFGSTTCCFWYKVLGDIHGNRYEKGNEAKHIGLYISIIFYFLNSFDFP